jgi:hypothetical protein
MRAKNATKYVYIYKSSGHKPKRKSRHQGMSTSKEHAVIMEQVAMYMAALPCPPLPLIVKQAISEDEDKECYKNSHDLIATLLLGAMSQGNVALNKQRREKQQQLTETLLKKLHASEGQVDRVYNACSEFTAGYVCAFMNLDVTVSFMPLDRVEQGDSVHKACCSWHKAQEIILAGWCSDPCMHGCFVPLNIIGPLFFGQCIGKPQCVAACLPTATEMNSGGA